MAGARQHLPDNMPACKLARPIPWGLTTPIPVTTMVLCISVMGVDRPDVEEIHPLIIMNPQRCFKKPDGLAQTGALAGIAVARSNRQDWVAHQSAVTQPSLTNYETGKHRGA